MKRPAAVAALTLSLAAGLAPGTAPDASAAAADGLDRFRGQSLTWTACPGLDPAPEGLECTAVTVPLDYARPRGRTIRLAVSRIRAADPAKRRGILQTNPGGPGTRGLAVPADVRAWMAPETAAAYDVIGMDTRGLGASSPLDCGLERGTWLRSAGADRAGFEEAVRMAKADADACWKEHADVLPHVSTRNTARDMDLVRSVLGERRTSFFGQSYGAVLGAVYAQMFPGRVDRLVLDSAPDPAAYWMRTQQAMGPAAERALDEFAAWAAQHPGHGLGSTAAAVRATVEGLVRKAAERPIPVAGFHVDDHVLPLVLHAYGMDEADNALYAGAVRQLLDAASGRPVEASEDLRAVLTALLRPSATGADVDLSAATATVCGDVTTPRDPDWYRRAVERSRAAQPVFGPLVNGPVPCAFWRERPREEFPEIGNDVPSLQLQAAGDTRTTYEGGLGMHRRMRGSRLVTVPVRTHGVLGSPHGPCARQAANDYLRDGTLPARDTVCAP
ncbi:MULTISPECIES: alpha/beta hydrolase [Streptomyces]|uniref:alpha/beta hydrolase n=1 Tax=Streptomyces TaxID=1883 RepID=UPI00167B74B1|nr:MULTISPECIES: alpha/beta hydrolase [Streptomyces]MBD3579465.1 alpha/beta fold hydrolase [Streptomyces sp. KD18]GGT22825.1 protease [Streptomyces toxytricini]